MAVRFDADGEDYLLTSAISGTTHSYCLWAVIDTDRNTFSSPIAVDDNSGSSVNYAYLETDSDGTSLRYFSNATSSTDTNFAVVSMTAGTWYFLAVSKNGTTATAYSSPIFSSTLTTTSGTARNPTATTFHLGETCFGAEWWNGRVAYVKVWNGIALTASEVAAEWASPTPVRKLDLWGYYPLHHGGPGSGLDYSGNNRHLTGGTSSATAWGPPVFWERPHTTRRKRHRHLFVEQAGASSQTATPLTSTVTLSGIAADRLAGAVTLSPGVSPITLTGIASGRNPGAVILTPGTSSISLTGVAADRSTIYTTSPLVSPISLSGVAPDRLGGAVSLTPGSSVVSLTGVAPDRTSVFTVPPGIASLGVSGVATDLAGGAVTLAPGTSTVSLTGVAVDRTSISTRAPSEAVVSLTGIAADRSSIYTIGAGFAPITISGVAAGRAPGVVTASPLVSEALVSGVLVSAESTGSSYSPGRRPRKLPTTKPQNPRQINLRHRHAQGLAGWYLGSAASQGLLDYSGYQRSGTITGTVTYQQSPYGLTIRTAASAGSFIKLQDWEADSATNSWTWCVRGKIYSVGSLGNNILGYRGNDSPINFRKLTNSNFEYYPGSIDGFISNSIPTGEWFTVVIVKDAGTLRYYYNGQLVGTSNPASWVISRPIYLANDPDSQTRTASEFTEAEYADVRLLNRALTAGEALLYHQAAPAWSLGFPETRKTYFIPNQGIPEQLATALTSTISITGVQSTVTPGGAFISPTTSTISVTGVQAARTSSSTITPTTATVSLTGVSADRSTVYTAVPGVSSATIAGVLVDRSAGAATAGAGVASVLVSGFSPTSRGGAVTVNPLTSTITISGIQPSAVTTGSSTPLVATVSTTAIATDRTAGATTVTSGPASIAVSVVSVDRTAIIARTSEVASISISVLSVDRTPGTVSPSPGTALINVTSTSVDRTSGSVSRAATVAGVTVSGVSPGTTAGVSGTPLISTITLTGISAVVLSGVVSRSPDASLVNVSGVSPGTTGLATAVSGTSSIGVTGVAPSRSSQATISSGSSVVSVLGVAVGTQSGVVTLTPTTALISVGATQPTGLLAFGQSIAAGIATITISIPLVYAGVVIVGPFQVNEITVYCPGSKQSQLFVPGVVESQVYVPGPKAVKVVPS